MSAKPRRLCAYCAALPLLLLLLLPLCAGAEAFCLARGAPDGAARISLYQDRTGCYLFLPSGIRTEEWRIYGPEPVVLAGARLSRGAGAPHLADGDTVRLEAGGKALDVRVMQSSSVPSLFITTQSGTLSFIHEKKTNKEPGAYALLSADGEPLAQGALEHVKARGNSSFQFNKKSYQIKLEKGEPLLGMDKAKRWVLIGNARDRSLLRNKVTLDLAALSGLACTPESESVDLYMNGEYRGTYLLCEKVEVNEGRVDIDDLQKETEAFLGCKAETFAQKGSAKSLAGGFKYFDLPADPADITGGYLVEYEAYPVRYKEEPSAYTTQGGAVLVVKSPEYASKAQMAYITSLLQRFEDAIRSPDGVDPSSGLRYDEIADLPSLARKYLIEEISKNYDGNQSSQFFYKPRDAQSTLLYAGPAWDYDSAYAGYAREKGMDVLRPEGLSVATRSGGKYWWPALYAHEDFRAAVARLYAQDFLPLLLDLTGDGGQMRSLSDYAQEIEDSAAMNFVRWPIPKNPTTAAPIGRTHAENVEMLRAFIEARAEFLAQEWAL